MQYWFMSHCYYVSHYHFYNMIYELPDHKELSCMPVISPIKLAKWPVFFSSFLFHLFFILNMSRTGTFGCSQVLTLTELLLQFPLTCLFHVSKKSSFRGAFFLNQVVCAPHIHYFKHMSCLSLLSFLFISWLMLKINK